MRKSIFSHSLLFVLFLYLIVPLRLAGQENVPLLTCATDELRAKLTTESDLQHAEIYESEYLKAIQSGMPLNPNKVIYNIPVVVHIMVDGTAAYGTADNPSDQMVQDAITGASNLYRHTSGLTFPNPFSGIDTEIQLKLAHKDPNNKYTTGIIRHYNPQLAYINYDNFNLDLFKAVQWPIDQYCNMFLFRKLDGAGAFYAYSNGVEGTFYNANSFSAGLIAHEVGHFFSLNHTFQGGCLNNGCLTDGDKVCDTPPKANPGTNGFSCASPGNSCTTDDDDLSANNPYRPVANGGLGDVSDMLENYMDYTGSCWAAFSIGQNDRMHFNITNSRTSLANNARYNNGTRFVRDAAVVSLDGGGICSPNPTVIIRNMGSTTLTSLTLKTKIDGVAQSDFNWSGSLVQDAQATVVLSGVTTPPGLHLIEVATALPNGSTDFNSLNDNVFLLKEFNIEPAAPPPSCSPSGSATAIGGIRRVTLEGMDAVSGGQSEDGTLYRDVSCITNTILTAGTTYTMKVQVGNASGPLFEQFAVFLDANNNGAFDAGESLYNTNGTGWYGYVSFSVTMPASPVKDTLLRLRVISRNGSIANACVNPGTGQTEDYGVIFSDKADLIIQGITLSATTIGAGGTTTVSYTLKNNGAASAPSSKVKVYFSENDVVDSKDVLLTTHNIGTLGAGISTNRSYAFTVPTTTFDGSYYVLMEADANNDVRENAETNNVGGILLSVNNPNSISASPASLNEQGVAGSDYFYLFSSGSWSATENGTWTTLTNSTGAGNGFCNFDFQTNPSATTTRVATITVNGPGGLIIKVPVNQATSDGRDCDQPSNVTADLILNDVMRFSWTPVPGGKTYYYRFRPFGSAVWTVTGSTTVPSVIFSGLAENTNYQFQLYCKCENLAKSGYSTLLKILTDPSSINFTGDDEQAELRQEALIPDDITGNTDDVNFELFPNPAINFVRITIQSQLKDTESELWLIDALGGRIQSRKEKIFTGNNEILWDTSKLSAGSYQIVLHANSNWYSKMFLIME